MKRSTESSASSLPRIIGKENVSFNLKNLMKIPKTSHSSTPGSKVDPEKKIQDSSTSPKVAEKTNKEKSISESNQLNKQPNMNTMTPVTTVFLPASRNPKNSSDCLWSKEENKLAYSVFYKSPKSYEYLTSLGIKLPEIDDIKTELDSIEISPGFNSQLMEQLTLKISTMSSEEKECVLMWGKTDIKVNFSSNNSLDGCVDLGFLGQMNKPAEYALIFMVRGFKSTWKIPLAYFLVDSNFNDHQLIVLLFSCLDQCIELNLKVKSMVCEHNNINKKLIKMLGITVNKPFFIYNDMKIAFNYDIPHLFQEVRNALTMCDIKIGDEKVTLDSVKELYERQANFPIKNILKIHKAHFESDYAERMNFILAAQLFSNSVGCQLINAQFEVDTNKNPHYLSTAKFLIRMNNLFDCLNSRYIHDPIYYKCGMSPKTQYIKEFLEDVINWINKWDLDLKNCFSLSLDFIPNLILSIRNVLILANENKFLLTTRLNLDTLFHTILRVKYDGDLYPDQIRSNLKNDIIENLIEPPTGSSTYDDDQSERYLSQLTIILKKCDESSE